ncbi:hypothetical protein BGZ47_001186 [Haplosporangium gracile]|nr:hypothetical protein BGZ47_001186 [Haplosporangium gracile]
MDRYSKSPEGIQRGSKVARNFFGFSTSSRPNSSHATSTANHSTQTGNEHVRFNNTISTNNAAHHNHNKAHRGTNNNNNNRDLRDALSMATKDKVVQQQLQKSQFYQHGIHDSLTVANTGKSTKDVEDEEAAVATDEEADIDRKLNPNLYDNVQYN